MGDDNFDVWQKDTRCLLLGAGSNIDALVRRVLLTELLGSIETFLISLIPVPNVAEEAVVHQSLSVSTH